MLKAHVYLNFDGNTEEAFNFYKEVFGGELTPIQKYKDMPPAQGEEKMPEEEGDLVMHVGLKISEQMTLMGTDISKARGMQLQVGNNMYITLIPDTKEETERLFKELSQGGKVEMPLEKMFWGDWFASFSDKYGVKWMIDYDEKSTD